MNSIETNIEKEVEMVGLISIVPIILKLVCHTTGMGFAAVARVTEERWVACEVRDEIQFGLRAGGELKIDTTICHEIRQSGKEVVIDHVEKDVFYRTHHTPAMYGFQSYISVPISREKDGFFGTLCAIDPSPAVLSTPEIIGMFKIYAKLISFHLNAIERLPPQQVSMLEEHSASVLNDKLGSLLEAATLSGESTVNRKSEAFISCLQHTYEDIQRLVNKLDLMAKMF